MPEPSGDELAAIRAHRETLRARYLRPREERPPTSVRGVHHAAFRETIGSLQHLAISASADQFAVAKAKLEAEGIEYLGPDRGADDSLYFRDPNGLGIELYRESLGVFEGMQLLPGAE